MTNIGMKVQGVAKVQVLSKGIIVEERPWTKNLVLAQGKDVFFGGTWAGSLARYCAVGTGTTTPASTDVGLESEVIGKRTGTLLTSGTGTARYADGRVVYTYTHDFAEETTNQNYTELGWSWSASAGNNLFSRVLISGGTVTVLAEQQLRVVYVLTWSVTPYVETAGTLTVAGWPVAPATTTAGTTAAFGTGFATMSSNGYIGPTNGEALEPANANCMCRVCSALTLNGGFTVMPANTYIYDYSGGAWAPYTSGSFTRSQVFTPFSAGSFASTSIRGFLYGNGVGFRFTDLQTKSNLHKLKPNGFSITLS